MILRLLWRSRRHEPWQRYIFLKGPESEKRMKHLAKIRPNHAMEPTPVNVTVPAYARTAPFTSVAHLGR